VDDHAMVIGETSVPRARVQRWRWLAVFLSGLVLWVLSVVVTGLTQNPNLIPTVVLLGSFLVPATAVIYYLDHSGGTTVSGQRVFLAFLYGGVLGVLAASVLEAWLLQNGPLVYVGVGLIEELVKLLALVLVALGIRHFIASDGIVLGAAVGFGFAALESSGYALDALFTPNGLSLTSLVFAEVLRGVLAPVGHGLWTGILGGALFAAAAKRGWFAGVFSVRLIGLFLLVSLLARALGLYARARHRYDSACHLITGVGRFDEGRPAAANDRGRNVDIPHVRIRWHGGGLGRRPVDAPARLAPRPTPSPPPARLTDGKGPSTSATRF
jgi:RsiW-degrading membrane proteinase PrsW (M82 family)